MSRYRKLSSLLVVVAVALGVTFAPVASGAPAAQFSLDMCTPPLSGFPGVTQVQWSNVGQLKFVDILWWDASGTHLATAETGTTKNTGYLYAPTPAGASYATAEWYTAKRGQAVLLHEEGPEPCT